MTAFDTTIAGNAGGDYGGGIMNQGTFTAINTTIAYNQTTSYGGGVYDNGGSTTTLYNTIVTVNTAFDGPDDIAGAMDSTAGMYNLVGIDETGSLSNGSDGNLLVGAANPGLGVLANNGGPTETIAVLAS